MRRYRRARALVLAFASCAALASLGCAGRSAPKKKPRPLIGFAMDSFVEERWRRDRDVFAATAASLGADVLVQVAEEDPAAQEAQVFYLMDRGIDVLVLVASDPVLLSKAVLDAKRRGVPVLLYERIVRHAGADLFLGYDGSRAGELQAAYVASRAVAARRAAGVPGPARLVVYNGLRNDVNAEAVHGGVARGLAPFVAEGTVAVVEDRWPATAGSEEAFAFMEGLLQAGPAPDGAIASKDLHAEAMIRALALRRLAGKVVVAGSDADLAACQRLVEGTQAMTVYKPIDVIAGKAAELAVYLARSERVTVHNAIDDGSYRVPYYELAPVAVDAANVRETVVKDGFHLEEDVFRNVLSRN